MPYAEFSGIQSYVSGVNYGSMIQNALSSRSSENKRLATTTSQEDYFKKQQLTKEALAQLESSGYVNPNIAKEVDIEALKDSIQKAKNGENSALDALSSTKSSAKPKQTNTQIIQDNALQSAISLENKNQILSTESKNTHESVQKDLQATLQSPVFQQAIVKTSTTPPQINSAQKDAYNPLEITETTQENSVQQGVKFTDKANGKEVFIPLDTDNAKKLTEHFGDLESASAFVEGYYYDVAYKMGYLEADIDNNGTISLDEAVNLRDFVDIFSGDYHSSAELMGHLTLEQQKEFLNNAGYVDNIATMINRSIMRDINCDGAINLAESFSAEGTLTLYGFQSTANAHTFMATTLSVSYTQQEILLHLGSKEQENTHAKQIETLKNFQAIKDVANTRYLESLDSTQREAVIKSDTILHNIGVVCI